MTNLFQKVKLLEILKAAGNYNERCVGNWQDEKAWKCVSTARVYDGDKQYETGIQHAEYNDGKMVIVEAYDKYEEAEAGHKKWIELVQQDKLPFVVEDCCNAACAKAAKEAGLPMTYARVKRMTVC